MNIEVLKYTGAIFTVAGVLWFVIKFFVIAPKQLKEHSKKHEKTDEIIKIHSEKITTLEANDKNREKADIRVEKAIDKLTDIITENQKTTIDMYKLFFEKLK